MSDRAASRQRSHLSPFERNRRRSSAPRLRLEPLEPRHLLATLIDINKGGLDAFPTYEYNGAIPVQVGSYEYFAANDAMHGNELWRTDGTAANTTLVQDLNVGVDPSDPIYMMDVSNTLVFSAYQTGDARFSQLWAMNPATGQYGEVPRPANLSSIPRIDGHMVQVGDTVYFAGYDNNLSPALYKYTTAGGISQVKSCVAAGNPQMPYGMTAVGNNVYFLTYDGTTSQLDIWSSDGTAANTNSLFTYANSTGNAGAVGAAGNNFYWSTFVTSNGGFDLFATSGASTTDLSVGNGGSTYPGNGTASGSNLFFSGNDGEIWQTNGSNGGTRHVQLTTSIVNLPYNVHNFGGTTIYFAGNDTQVGGTSLYSYNSGSITRLAHLTSGIGSALQKVGNRLYFDQSDANGHELWSVPATGGTPTMVKDINPGTDADGYVLSSNPLYLSNFNNTKLLFVATSLNTGYEMFVSNGNAGGTNLVKDINPDTFSSDAGASDFGTNNTPGFAVVGSNAYFSAIDGVTGRELWKTDGTAANTTRVKDIWPGSGNSNPQYLTPVGNTIYFIASDPVQNAITLFKTDGTDSGTTPFMEPANYTAPYNLVNVGGTLMYNMYNRTTSQVEFWRTNGGTPTLVKAFAGNDPYGLVVSGSTLYFQLYNPATSLYDLWKSDGTSGGTVPVVQAANSNSSGYNAHDVTSSGGKVYFTAYDSTVADYTLWSISGGVATSLASLPHPVGTPFFDYNNKLIYEAFDPAGRKFVSTNGTAGGTFLITAAGDFDTIKSMANVAGNLFIVATDDHTGKQTIVVSNGQALSGTSYGVELPYSVSWFTAVGSRVYFQMYSVANGVELWSSTGTQGGTQLVEDLNPYINGLGYPNDSNPIGLTDLNGTLLYSANDGVHGNELFSTTPPTNAAPVLTAGSPTLTTIAEDTANPAGNTVGSFAGPLISDIDLKANSGIAVTRLTEIAHGDWQYSLNGGTTWLAMGNPSEAAALLLAGNSKVRFVPHANYNGSPTLTSRAWDGSDSLTAGSTTNTNNHRGGTGAYSTTADVATLTVTAVNDAPLLATTPAPTLTSFNEDSTNPPRYAVSGFAASLMNDPDVGALKGIAVTTLTATTQGQWQFSLNNGTSWTNCGTPSDSAALLLDFAAKIRFLPNLNFNGDAKLRFRAWDQTDGAAVGSVKNISSLLGGSGAYSTTSALATLTVNPVNDAPVVTLSGSTGYKHGNPPLAIATTASVQDIDSPDFAGGQLLVQIMQGQNAGNILALSGNFSVDASGNVKQGSTLIGTLNSGGGQGTTDMIISFNASATAAVVQSFIRSLTFSATTAGQRSLLFRLTDGDGGTGADRTRIVNVT